MISNIVNITNKTTVTMRTSFNMPIEEKIYIYERPKNDVCHSKLYHDIKPKLSYKCPQLNEKANIMQPFLIKESFYYCYFSHLHDISRSA